MSTPAEVAPIGAVVFMTYGKASERRAEYLMKAGANFAISEGLIDPDTMRWTELGQQRMAAVTNAMRGHPCPGPSDDEQEDRES